MSTITEIAIDLMPDFAPGHLDGKLRIAIENGKVEFRCDRSSGTTYLAAQCEPDEFMRAMVVFGLTP